MALTKRQIEKIQRAIKSRTLAFVHEAIGERALTRGEIRQLKELGLLRSNVRNLVMEPYAFGKLIALTDRRKATDMSYDEARRRVKENLIPKTAVERRAIEYAQDHAGQYIRALGTTLSTTATTTTARAGMDALRAVKKEVVGALKNRKTVSELKTALFSAVDDTYRDWHRVAFTEMNDAIQNGIYEEIKRQSDDGENQLVYKRPNPDGCKYCKALYLDADGITPKIFRLRDLAPSNVGRKAKDWLPTVGSIHPWCSCQLHTVIEGFSFVKKRVVAEDFVSQGKQYRKGEIVEVGVFDNLSASQKMKTREESVLAHTGKKLERSFRKGLGSALISETECDHTFSY